MPHARPRLSTIVRTSATRAHARGAWSHITGRRAPPSPRRPPGTSAPGARRPSVVRSSDGARAQVKTDPIRTSSQTFLARGADQVTRGIEERIARFAMIPYEHGEDMQVSAWRRAALFSPLRQSSTVQGNHPGPIRELLRRFACRPPMSESWNIREIMTDPG